LRIERDWLDRIIENGYIDTFRHFHPDTVKYSWWTYRFKARDRNVGWRIDYFFVTQDIIATATSGGGSIIFLSPKTLSTGAGLKRRLLTMIFLDRIIAR